MDFSPSVDALPQNRFVVRFQLTPADDKAARAQFSRTQNSSRNVALALLVLFALILAASLAFRQTLAPARPVPVAVAGPTWLNVLSLFLPLVFLAAFWFFILKFQVATKNSPIFRFPSEVTLSPQSVSHSNDTTVQTVEWRGFKRVEKTLEHLFLFLPTDYSMIVPRRAFASEAEFEEFCAFAQAQWHQAQPIVPAPPPIAAA